MSAPWFKLIQGDCLASLKTLEDNSIDSRKRERYI